MFRKSGAVESVRAEKLEAAGFWEVSGDIINVHFVASPAFFHDDQEAFTELKAFEGEFYAFRIRVVPFNVELDKFEAVGLLGEQVKKAVFSRCKD
jgi:hypothetical protein